jgi:glucose-1-phosphatase
MNNISTVIFDLGRVLVHIDFEAFPNALGLKTKADREPYEKERSIETIALQYETGKISTDDFLSKLEIIFKGKFSHEYMLYAWNEIIGKENQEIVSVVREVQKNYRTAVLSNTSESHWEKALATAPVLATFPRYFLSYEIGFHKPDPEIYDAVLRSLQTPPEKILFIDDIRENIQAAEKKGIKGIVFTSVEQLRKDMLRYIQI